MKVRIEKELLDPVVVNGYAEIQGPLYHIYKVKDDGNEELIKTIEGSIEEAARYAERVVDLNALEVAYKESGPLSFSSVTG